MKKNNEPIIIEQTFTASIDTVWKSISKIVASVYVDYCRIIWMESTSIGIQLSDIAKHVAAQANSRLKTTFFSKAHTH